MGLEPINFSILANGNDISKLIKDRLIRLTISDSQGEESDTLEIEIDNRDSKVTLPATGADLAVFIGYGDELIDKGLYQVDEVIEPLEIDTFTIHAKAAKIKQSFKAPRSENHENITIGELVNKIAARHNFKPSVSASLANIRYENINQEGESDMNLLTRLARENSALVKPIANRLLFVTKDESKTASGKSLEEIKIDDPSESTGNVQFIERTNYESVKCFWFDQDKAERQEVTAGSGEPLFTIKRHYKDEEKARNMAESKLKALQRGNKTMSLTRPLIPNAVAEGPVIVSNHKKSANGKWIIDQVTHTIQSGQVASTSMSLHLPK